MKREEVLKALEDFPEGATVDDIRAWFDHVPSWEHVNSTLGRLVRLGQVERLRPPNDAPPGWTDYARRRKFKLVKASE